MHMGAARKKLITSDQDYASVQGLIRQQPTRIRGSPLAAPCGAAKGTTLARILAFLLLGKISSLAISRFRALNLVNFRLRFAGNFKIQCLNTEICMVRAVILRIQCLNLEIA